MSEQTPLPDPERILRDLEQETLERLESNEAMAESPKMDASVGRLTYIDAYQQQQVALHARRRLQSQLASIRAALDRVTAGTYGTCLKCGTAILPERLEYMPDTPFCTQCNAGQGG